MMCYTGFVDQDRDAGVLIFRNLRNRPQPNIVVTRTPVTSGTPRAVLVGCAGVRCDGGSVMEAEIWKPIPGYEDHFEASDLGRVRRITSYHSSMAGDLVIPAPHGNGYLTVRLSHPGKVAQRACYVHTLVVLAFYGPRPDGFCCNHKDGVKTNNHASNLEWVTPQENVRHAFRTGLMPPASRMPGGHMWAKLSWSAAVRIRKLVAEGIAQRALAREYGVDIHTIGQVVRNETWKEQYRAIYEAESPLAEADARLAEVES